MALSMSSVLESWFPQSDHRYESLNGGSHGGEPKWASEPPPDRSRLTKIALAAVGVLFVLVLISAGLSSVCSQESFEAHEAL